MKYLKGSLTVEASILLPIIIFIIVAQLYMIFFLHDSAVLQSKGYRISEGMLWERDDDNLSPLYKMEMGNYTVKKKKIVEEIKDIVDCRESVTVEVRGSMSTNTGYIRPFIGDSMSKKYKLNMLRVCYIEDRIRSVILQRMKKNE